MLQRMQVGLKTQGPSKPMRLFLSVAAMFARSLAVELLESSVTAGTAILQTASAVLKLMGMYVAWVPSPNMQTILFLGINLVPPKFLGLCRIIYLLK
jgi:hypothetical protein